MAIDWNTLESHYATRLIPNPRGAPEGRAVAALLSMVRGVSEFGGRFVKRCGGPRYKNMPQYTRCFAEVPFSVLSGEARPGDAAKTPPHKRHYNRPDGIVLVRKGRQEWKALVEVKVGAAKLEDDPEQIAEYHRQASALGFDALITISNEPAQPGGLPPRGIDHVIDGRRVRRCPVAHIPWRDLLGEAQALVDQDLEENVEDFDQDWMLTEWIRYVTDEASGILERPTLGEHWSEILEQAAQSRLPRRSEELHDAIAHWVGYWGEVGYHLRLLGIRVVPKLSRKEKADPEFLHRRLCDECAKSGVLIAEWKVPRPVDAIRCELRLAQRKIHYSFDVTAFDGKTAASRVMAWIGQFDRSRAPEDLRATISWRGSRTKTSFLLRDIEGTMPLQRELQAQGIERSAWPAWLTFEWVTELPRKRGQKGVAHLEAVTAGMVRFYGDVAAGLRSVERMPRGRVSQTAEPAELAETAGSKVEAEPLPAEDIPPATTVHPAIAVSSPTMEHRDSSALQE